MVYWMYGCLMHMCYQSQRNTCKWLEIVSGSAMFLLSILNISDMPLLLCCVVFQLRCHPWLLYYICTRYTDSFL